MNIENKRQWIKAFTQACETGVLKDVQHLCQKQYLDCGWADIHWNSSIEYHWEGFHWACREGHLEVIKYLLTSPELKEAGHTFADLHSNREGVLIEACLNGQLSIIQYLLTSPELIEAGHTWADVHAQNDQGFLWACGNEQWEVVRWLVFDYGLEKTRDIEKIMEQYPQVQEYFRVREERQAIQGVFDDPGLISSFSERTDEKVIKKAKKL